MSDSVEQIPLWTWYNGQFLFQFDQQLRKNPHMPIGNFFEDFLKDQKLENLNFYHTKNQGTVILLMYGLLVIPKEIWEKKNTNFKFTTRNRFNLTLPKDQIIDTFNFLRLLRNSLAHANFSIDTTNLTLKFWNNNNNKKNFEAEIDYTDLGEFLSEIGKYYINEVKNNAKEK